MALCTPHRRVMKIQLQNGWTGDRKMKSAVWHTFTVFYRFWSWKMAVLSSDRSKMFVAKHNLTQQIWQCIFIRYTWWKNYYLILIKIILNLESFRHWHLHSQLKAKQVVNIFACFPTDVKDQLWLMKAPGLEIPQMFVKRSHRCYILI